MSDPNSTLTFEQMMANLKRHPKWQQLPDIRVAMWPNQVSFADDLSDRDQFNERYIESRLIVGKAAFVLYLFSGGFLMSLFVTIWGGYYEILRMWRGHQGGFVFSWEFFIFMLFTGIVGTLLLRLKGGIVRFNRQAQLVHIYDGPNKATTLSWREVYPFTQFSTYGDGKFALKLIFRTGPTDVSVAHGALDISDEQSLVDNLSRVEFLRRYMAEGLPAVQPDPQRTLYKPSGFSKPVTLRYGLFDFLFDKLVITPGYYLAGGPLIDRYLIRRAARAQWPADVERLCAPGADLSGYDTTPVKAREDVFYRFNGQGFDLVNRQGDVVG
ncbi:hypothetical protein [Burkholderia sp. BCC1999]|uniref:hypothetical protein n=1 Tax=Burkholderia sp. BCC1999 TaxID=2817448 RepID=UPI002AC35448|nr:hypothetical protein [Burkholderia sp. BCC1999]